MVSQPVFTTKKLYQDLAILFFLALLVRLLAAWPQQQPGYMDAAYYYTTAVNLAEGRGFVQDFVWNYLTLPGPPPQPSHTYWMPLTSLLAALGMVVGGINYRAAQLAFVLLSALLAPISYWVAFVFSTRRDLSWLAGVLAIFSGFYVPFWTAIDNFAPFAVTGSLALLAAWYGMDRPTIPSLAVPILLFLAGLLAGLAHLARADGFLLLLVILFFALWRIVRAGRLTKMGLLWLLLPLLGYLLAMLPWFWRNWQLLGTPLPVAGSKTIWLVGYDDLFGYNREISARAFWAQGPGSILRGRWWALSTNLQTVLAVWGMIVMAPLALVGGWALRRHGLLQLAAGYALLLFVVMTLFFAFPGARGGLFHSGGALLPYIFGAGVVGLERSVAWAARRRQHWRPQSAVYVFSLGVIILAVALSALIYYRQVLRENAWNRADASYPVIAGWVAAHDPQAIVMIGNPPAFRYHGGGLSVVVPNADLPTTVAAARRYNVRYLVLDRNHPLPLAALYQNPTSGAGLKLVETFGSDVYLFEVEP